MNRCSIHRISPLALAALVLAGALAWSMLAPAAVPARGGPSITLKVSENELRPGRSTDLTGELSGVFTGSDGRTVTLMESPYPYDSETVADTTTTDADGRFSFEETPELNSRYRAVFDGGPVDGSASSPVRQVYVFAKTKFRLRLNDRGTRANGAFTLIYSPRVQPEYYVGRKIHWYFRKTSQPRYRRVATTRMRDKPRGAKGKVSYRLPRSRNGYRFQMGYCLASPARDVGIGNEEPDRCPRSFAPRVGAGADRAPVQAAG